MPEHRKEVAWASELLADAADLLRLSLQLLASPLGLRTVPGVRCRHGRRVNLMSKSTTGPLGVFVTVKFGGSSCCLESAAACELLLRRDDEQVDSPLHRPTGGGKTCDGLPLHEAMRGLSRLA